ncbi:MAG: ABC transporter permease subunit [Thermoplasmata archaeon]
MNPYRHEFQHLLRSKAVIAVVIIGVVAGTFGYLAVSNAVGQVSISGAGFWYYLGGEYHVELWAFDNAGTAVSGVRVDLNLTTPFNFTVVPPTVLLNETLTSDANGRVQFVFPLPSGNYSASVTAKYPAVSGASTNGALSSGFGLLNSPIGTLNPIGSPLNVVADTFYSDLSDYLLIWEGPNGTLPSGDQALSCSFVTSYSNYSTPFPTNCTGQSGVSTQVLGSVSAFRTVLPIPATPSTSLTFPQVFLQFIEITNSTGAVIYSSAGGLGGYCSGVCIGPSLPGSQTPGPGILSSFATELSFFLPLIALLVTYWSYARPRLTGTLEPVLVRPVTRRGIFLVRYGTVALALLIATIAEVLLLDLGVSVVLREPLPLSFLAPLVGGLATAAIGFAGLIFLSAHTFRSTGPVLALGIALLLVFSLFWGFVVLLVLFAFGFETNPQLYTSAIRDIGLRSQLLAPPQFPSITTGLLTGSSNSGIVAGSYADAGITALVVGVAAALWIAVPFLLTHWRVVTRD